MFVAGGADGKKSFANIRRLRDKRSMPTFGKRNFEVVLGSDIVRDGMYLEISEDGGKPGIAEVFFSDQTGELVLNTFGNEIPIETVEWLVSEARVRLSPKA